MARGDWPHWLRAGIIGSIIYPVALTILQVISIPLFFVCYGVPIGTNTYCDFSGAVLDFLRAVSYKLNYVRHFPELQRFLYDHNVVEIIFNLTQAVLTGFVLGILIGLIVQKIKSKGSKKSMSFSTQK
jgi:hypothetical protein